MIRNWTDYENYLKPAAGIATGHVANKDLSLRQVKEELAKVRGHLVDMPLDFLSVSPRRFVGKQRREADKHRTSSI